MAKIIKRTLIFLLGVSVLTNFLFALSPELGFDALWYHLTLPKLYLAAGKIYHVQGGLLYYSELPRLAEFLYIPLIKLMGDTGPHLLSFSAGIGTTVILYKLSRKFVDKLTALLICALFYATPLVSWQSGSAYVDLIRTFFETLAFYLVIQKKYIWAGLMLGLAISTKTLALGSIPVLAFISWFDSKKISNSAILIFVSLLVALPWFSSAWNNTGYPFYPIGAGILDQSHILNFDIWNFPFAYFKLFIMPEDLISPIYVLFLPFLFFVNPKDQKAFKMFLIYFLLTFLIWFITPRTGGGRFILPYLPIWSLLVGLCVFWQKSKKLKLFLTCLIIGGISVNVFYRCLALTRNVPYLLGFETKEEFLCNRLDFSTSVFVDCDGFFARNIKKTDLVLVKGIHNLSNINFPFVHETWYNGEKFNYVLSDKTENLKLIYKNSKTRLNLYKK